MATKNLSFGAQIADWTHRVKGAQSAIFKQSAQEVVEDMQRPRGAGGRMRVDTGFLRASLMASTTAMPSINAAARPTDGAGANAYSADFGQIEAVIAGAEIGDTLHFGYTASYAAAREYGARGQPPDAFVGLAAQKWPTIVDRVTAELRRRLDL